MHQQREWYRPPWHKTLHFGVVAVATAMVGGTVSLLAWEKGDTAAAFFAAICGLGGFLGSVSNLRYLRVDESGVEHRWILGVTRATWDEIESIEPIENRPFVVRVGPPFGYLVRTTAGRFWVYPIMEPYNELVAKLHRGFNLPRPLDDGFSVHQDCVEVVTQPVFFWALILLSVVTLPIAVSFWSNAFWFSLIAIALGAAYFLCEPTKAVFTPEQVRIKYLLWERAIPASSLQSVKARSLLYGAVLDLHFSRQKVQLRSTVLVFDAYSLERRLVRMYRLRQEHE